MIIIRKHACARAALLGNPSDGYHGRTIAVIIRDFRAEVVLYEWDSLDILAAENDRVTSSRSTTWRGTWSCTATTAGCA